MIKNSLQGTWKVIKRVSSALPVPQYSYTMSYYQKVCLNKSLKLSIFAFLLFATLYCGDVQCTGGDLNAFLHKWLKVDLLSATLNWNWRQSTLLFATNPCIILPPWSRHLLIFNVCVELFWLSCLYLFPFFCVGIGLSENCGASNQFVQKFKFAPYTHGHNWMAFSMPTCVTYL